MVFEPLASVYTVGTLGIKSLRKGLSWRCTASVDTLSYADYLKERSTSIGDVYKSYNASTLSKMLYILVRSA